MVRSSDEEWNKQIYDRWRWKEFVSRVYRRAVLDYELSTGENAGFDHLDIGAIIPSLTRRHLQELPSSLHRRDRHVRVVGVDLNRCRGIVPIYDRDDRRRNALRFELTAKYPLHSIDSYSEMRT